MFKIQHYPTIMQQMLDKTLQPKL